MVHILEKVRKIGMFKLSFAGLFVFLFGASLASAFAPTSFFVYFDQDTVKAGGQLGYRITGLTDYANNQAGGGYCVVPRTRSACSASDDYMELEPGQGTYTGSITIPASTPAGSYYYHALVTLNGSSDWFASYSGTGVEPITVTTSTQGGGSTGQIRVTASPATVAPGGAVTISVTGGPANGDACVFPADETINSWCYDTNTNIPQIIQLSANGSGSQSGVEVSDTPGSFQIAIATRPASGGNFSDSGARASVTISETTGGGGGGGGGNTGIPECDALPAIPPQLKQGSSGAAVTCLQRLLTQKGFTTTADGQYGPATFNAVKDYQTGNGLNCRDGVTGPETWGSLLGRVINQPTKCNQVPPGGGGTPPDDGGGGGPPGGGGGGGSGLDCAGQGLQEKNGLCLPVNPNEGGKGLVSCNSVGSCLNTIIRFLLTLAAIIAVLFIIIGGFLYMTSAGNEERAGKGKKTLTYAVIGLGAVVLAYTIVVIVYRTLTQDSLF